MLGTGFALLTLNGKTATFMVDGVVVLAPGLEGVPVSIIKNIEMTVTVTDGGPGKGTLELRPPSPI